MFSVFWTALDSITLGLALGGASIVGIGFVILAMINAWGILDPRTGAQVKGGLIKIILTGAFLGLGGGIPQLAKAIVAGG